MFDSNEEKGVAIEYPSIILHSLVTKPTLQVYLQISVDSIERNGSRLMLQNEGDDGYFMEITFEGNDCERIYESLCECSTLHPSLHEDWSVGSNENVGGSEDGGDEKEPSDEEESLDEDPSGGERNKIARIGDQEE